jgi:hypothetical protein
VPKEKKVKSVSVYFETDIGSTEEDSEYKQYCDEFNIASSSMTFTKKQLFAIWLCCHRSGNY